jgi:hypothetical protein
MRSYSREEMDTIRQEATDMYAEFPRPLRHYVYARIMENQDFPFHDDPNDSFEGRWFAIATGNFPAPVAQEPLHHILYSLGEHLDLPENQITDMFRIYRDTMAEVLNNPHEYPMPVPQVPVVPENELLADTLHTIPVPTDVRRQYLPEHCGISLEAFHEGDRVIRLMEDNNWIFHFDPLIDWFETSVAQHIPLRNPLTNLPLHQGDIEVLELHIIEPIGGKRKRKSLRKHRVRKSKTRKQRE